MLAPGRSLTAEPSADEHRSGPLPDGVPRHSGHGGQPGAGGGLTNLSQVLVGQLLDSLRIHGTSLLAVFLRRRLPPCAALGLG
jgi:hypothetical protein